MKSVKVVVPVEIDKAVVQQLNEELENTTNLFMATFIIDILDKVHSKCEAVGDALSEIDKHNPCNLWPRIKERGGEK